MYAFCLWSNCKPLALCWRSVQYLCILRKFQINLTMLFQQQDISFVCILLLHTFQSEQDSFINLMFALGWQKLLIKKHPVHFSIWYHVFFSSLTSNITTTVQNVLAGYSPHLFLLFISTCFFLAFLVVFITANDVNIFQIILPLM